MSTRLEEKQGEVEDKYVSIFNIKDEVQLLRLLIMHILGTWFWCCKHNFFIWKAFHSMNSWYSFVARNLFGVMKHWSKRFSMEFILFLGLLDFLISLWFLMSHTFFKVFLFALLHYMTLLNIFSIYQVLDILVSK